MLSYLYNIRFGLLAITVVVSYLLWPFVQSAVKVDNSLTIWFLKDDPALKEYKLFHQKFGNDEMVVLVVKDEKTLLTKKHFTSFIAMTKALESMPEVQMVIGPGNADVVSKDILGLLSKPLITDSSDPADVNADLESMPRLKEQLYNQNYTAARFLISFKSSKDFDNQRGVILNKVRESIYKYLPSSNSYFGGVGIIYEGLNELSNADFGFFLGIGYLAMFVLLLWIYRKPVLLLYAISTIAISTYITIGIYGLAGLQLNLMTILIPAILIVLGIMDIMHILNVYLEISDKNKSKKASTLLALKQVFKPCLFTTLTTMAGFLSLMISPMPILQQFGLFTALGIFLCLVFTYVFGVIFMPVASPSTITIFSARNIVNQILASVLKHKTVYTIVSAMVVIVSITGMFFIKTDTYTLGYFPAKNKVVKDHEMIEKVWGPYMPLELVVNVKDGKKLHDPAVVMGAIAFADSAQKIMGGGKIFGFHSFYQAALTAQYGKKDQLMLKSRTSLQNIHDQLPFYYPDLYKGFVHEQSQTGRITLFGTMTSAKELDRKMDTILKIANNAFGNSAKISPSGYQPMYADIVAYVTNSQINSLTISAFSIFI
ncbi:MAG TPA: MMPL family transporter, partial [Segetibacter sp.]